MDGEKEEDVCKFKDSFLLAKVHEPNQSHRSPELTKIDALNKGAATASMLTQHREQCAG